MLLLLADGVKIEPLNCVQLSRATSFPLHVVKNCVQETILLYCFLLRSKEHVPFAFRDIGVLTCEDGFPCMKFYLDCVKRLGSIAGLVALLHSRMWPAHLTAFSGETTARGIQMIPSFREPSWQAAAEEEEAFPPHPDKLGAGHKAARCGEEAVYQPRDVGKSCEGGDERNRGCGSFAKLSKVPHLAPLSLRSGQGTEQCPPALTVIPFPVSQELPPRPFCLFCVQGVRVAGLGTFGVVREQFHGKEELLLIRRPFFQLDIDELWLEEIYCPTEILPDGVKIEPLNCVQLSRATSFPLHVVKNCVQETILLYCFLLRSKEHVPFAFRDIGVLTCEDGFPCMKFYLDCVKRLGSIAGLVALLHSRMWPAHLTAFSGETTARGIQMIPRFHLTVRRRPEAKASTTSQEEASGERRIRRVSECHPGKLLQRRKKLSLPILTSWEPGTRQQDVEKKPSTRRSGTCLHSGTKQTAHGPRTESYKSKPGQKWLHGKPGLRGRTNRYPSYWQ
ncbi:coiled-coil domain-containing protein 81-like [Anser cygnoides]|uniref:coiled-coil domain-containing protein 81-like n=1 Tax=Anser cygnoides TaxID=8845 RepID=UPI0034D17A8C